jgi:hypothetical protein
MLHTDHIRVDPAYREALRGCGLDSVASILSRVDGRVVAWSRTTDTLYVPNPRGGPGFYVKRYLYPRWSKRVRGAFRGTFFGMHRGQVEFRALNRLRELGIPAVRAVAYGGRRILHFVQACFLITEEAPGTCTLMKFADDVATGQRALDGRRRRAIVRALAAQIAELHATGFSHGNLFWRNVLIRFGPDGSPEFFLVDPQPLLRWRGFPAPERWYRIELAQLAVSAGRFATTAEMVRFARFYYGVRRLTDAIRAELGELERIARTWRTHEARRIRLSRLFDEWNRRLDQESALSGGAAPTAAGMQSACPGPAA